MAALPRTDALTPGLSVRPLFDVDKAPFGDGYRRVARKGIQTTSDTRRLTWVPLPYDEAIAIYNVLVATDGVDSIEWTPPNEATELTWTVEKVEYRYDTPMTVVVTATLERFYG